MTGQIEAQRRDTHSSQTGREPSKEAAFLTGHTGPVDQQSSMARRAIRGIERTSEPQAIERSNGSAGATERHRVLMMIETVTPSMISVCSWPLPSAGDGSARSGC